MWPYIDKYMLSLLIPLLLIGSGIFFLIYLRFFFILHPRRSFSVFFRKSDGGVSPFSALTVALAGTLGVGNIVGVSGAIILGGAGAVFWMWVSALAAMVLKYGEIVLAHRHRKRSEKGTDGGAMYYIEDFYKGRGGRILAMIFAVFCLLNSLSMGCMLQSNAVSSSFSESFDIDPLYIGIFLALASGIVIFKNVHDISPLTRVIIPLITLGYIFISLMVIVRFRSGLPSVLSSIFKSAFSFRSASSGILGFLMSEKIRYGCMRGLVSNEAGCGTAPIAHAESSAPLAAEQGIWGIAEVFVDTILLCSLTAFSILLVFGDKVGGFALGDEMRLVISSYSSVLGDKSGPIISVMVLFFAYATIICWAYYGIKTLEYMSDSRTVGLVYKLVYVFCIVIGSLHVSEAVWHLSDISLGVMTLINLITMLLMRKEIREETTRFIK